DPADLLEVSHRADAMHHGAEDHRRDHHLDQRDEAVAERLESGAGMGKPVAERDAERDREQDLDIENLVPRLAWRHGGLRSHGRRVSVPVACWVIWWIGRPMASRVNGDLGGCAPPWQDPTNRARFV